MKTKETAKKIYDEYQELSQGNAEIDLYSTVARNENFFIGKQWEGVNAPAGLEKPVFNILKRIIAYFISIIVSDDISTSISSFDNVDEYTESLLKATEQQINQVIERAKIKSRNRDLLRNAAVDGDACVYLYFNPSDNGGNIEFEIIDNTNILFGNPQLHDIQKQPYLIAQMRKTLREVKKEARENGLSEDDIENIKPDDDENNPTSIRENGKVTVLIKFFKDDDGCVNFVKCTKDTIIKEQTNLEYKLYPLAYFSWDKIKNNYHGQSAVSGLLPNQIFINKLFAMSMEHVRNMAFPKIIYNKSLVDRWDNNVGACIGVMGDPNMAIASSFKAQDMSNQVLLMIEKVIQYTRDTMGASDAALGNVRPDNTSAIIAVQKSSAMPLELQRLEFYQFVEDYVRIIIEIIAHDYGVREIHIDDTSNSLSTSIDFSDLQRMDYKLNVDVGTSAYWSELMQVQTMDSLFQKQIVTDAVTYLESIPNGYIKNKQKLIDKLNEQKEQQAQMLPLEFGGGI